MSFRKTLLITGASSGFGQALAREALDAGHRVVGTVRSEEARSALEAVAPGQAFGRLLDVTDLAAIEPTVAAIERDIGPLDVLVNSAGYGHEGILEESPLAEMRRQFEVNLFGAVAMIQAVLPYMRRRRRGHILNITSMGGYITMPGIAYYCGSKFALEGVSEALGKEVAGLGIAVTAVAPAPSAPTGRAARWSAARAPSPTTTRSSTRSARRAGKRAASNRATRARPRAPCSRPSTRKTRRRTCCWAAMHWGWCGRS
ncbi:oxidoreductase [Pseudomonas aeruginosa]|nr:oxidoreductase [Pseudomonas aeruginosa]